MYRLIKLSIIYDNRRQGENRKIKSTWNHWTCWNYFTIYSVQRADCFSPPHPTLSLSFFFSPPIIGRGTKKQWKEPKVGGRRSKGETTLNIISNCSFPLLGIYCVLDTQPSSLKSSNDVPGAVLGTWHFFCNLIYNNGERGGNCSSERISILPTIK